MENYGIVEEDNVKQVSVFYNDVNEQILSKEMPFVSEVFYSLQKKGCYRKQAKTVIAQVYATEKQLAEKEGRDFDVNKYESALKQKNRLIITPDRIRNVTLDIEMELNAAFEDIADSEMDEGYEYCAEKLLAVWPRTKKYIIDYLYRDAAAGMEKPEIYDLAVMTEYRLTFDALLPDMAMILHNADRYEEEISYCKDILELFSWERNDPSEFKDDIGMALRDGGDREAAVKWYEDWLSKEPDNGDCVNGYAFLLQIEGKIDEALRLVEAHLPETEPIDLKYGNLYSRAGELYAETGNAKLAEHYRKLGSKCYDIDEMELSKPAVSGDEDWKPKPLVKDKKIYPNDPCPCGSGKKYKKCCGRKGL